MKVEINNLITPSKYAKKHGITRDWVYKLIKKGSLKSLVISGVVFVREK